MFWFWSKVRALERIYITRPKPAYGRQGLDWIVRPGYSFVVFSTNNVTLLIRGPTDLLDV